MKKILGLFFVLFAFTFVMSSGAYAASSAISSTNGVYTFGSEWLAGQGSVPVNFVNEINTPGQAAPGTWTSTVQYIPAIDLGINNTIRIKITNGAVKKTAGNVYTLWNTSGTPIRCATMIDFVPNGNNDYTEMVFQFVQTTSATAPSVLSGATIIMTEDVDGLTDPTFITSYTFLSAGNTQVQVIDARDATSNVLEAPKTLAASVITKIDQLSAKIQHLAGPADGWATSVINVEAAGGSRSKFIAEAGGDTSTLTSKFQVLVNPATVNNGVNLATASYTMTLVGDQTAISNVALEGLGFAQATGVSWTISSDFATRDLRVANTSDRVTITVDGTTVIDTATFLLNLTITPSEAGIAPKLVLNQVTAAVWTVNAMQARIPYMLVDTRTTGNAGYSSFFELTNRSSQEATVSIDAIISNEDGTVSSTETQANVLTLPANSVIIVRQADLDNAFTNIDNTKLYRVSLVLTVVAAQNSVDVTAWHIGPTTRTSAAVLYNTDNRRDGRKWQ